MPTVIRLTSLALVAVLVVACSPATRPSTPTAQATATATAGRSDDLASIAAAACADAHFPRCVEDVLTVADLAPGSLIAVCDYERGRGDVVLLESEGDAAGMCSGDGLISPSRVVSVVQLP